MSASLAFVWGLSGWCFYISAKARADEPAAGEAPSTERE
jgi:hypothetical protein